MIWEDSGYDPTILNVMKVENAPIVDGKGDALWSDVRFGANWNDGIWTVEISRRLKTGNSDDIQFVLDEEFFFGVAVFDNSRHGYQHKTSEMYSMKFLR